MPDFNLYLGDRGSAEQFKPPKVSKGQRPIDLLVPGSDHHKYVLNYLLDRIKTSEDQMRNFYGRWQVAERKMQAYMTLPNYEQMLKNMNNNSEPPAPAIIVFPYKYAVISTIVSYCLKVFCGKKPWFNLTCDSTEGANVVHYMETMVQRHLEACMGILRIYQALLDGELYGVGIIRNTWKTKFGRRRVVRQPTAAEQQAFTGSPGAMPGLVRDHEDKIIWAGNDLQNIDPFMFFPDPNVPMNMVSEKGEYVFWREFVGKHILIMAQKLGQLHYVDAVEPLAGNKHDSEWFNLSQRNVLTGGKSHAGEQYNTSYGANHNTYMVDQGSVEIIPAELGLGPEEYPIKYLFTVLNKEQIVQCEELDLDHGRHPVEVSEPYSLGYGFGQPAMGDYIGPIQDILSWFVASHIYNIRANLNNEFLFDPSKVNEDDMKHPQPGRRIRLKPLAYGTDVRTVFTQLQVSDVTRGHMSDLTTFKTIGDMVSHVNDAMRGVQSAGGRKTATEVRRTDENAFSFLGEHARLISQTNFTRLTEQMTLNIQQLQEPEFWIKVIGQQAFAQHGPMLLTGDFTYPVHDGTLPLDRILSFDVWKEILLGMAQSPTLQMTHSFPKVFEYVCTLGGAPNISSFRLMSDTEMDAAVKAGNMIQMREAAANVPADKGSKIRPNGALPQ